MSAAPSSTARKPRTGRIRLALGLLIALVTLGAVLSVALGLHLEPNVVSLLPEQGESAALLRYVRGFGGGDLGVVMVRGEDPEENAAVAEALAEALAKMPSVERASAHAEVPRGLDPMLAFRYADRAAEERLARALTPEGMRARLRETRALLLAPGSSALAETVTADPLRLTQLAFERTGFGAGMRTQPSGAFATDDGKMCLVLVAPRGQALRGADAKRFVADAERAMDEIGKDHPKVTLGLTGGHAIAAATERMLTRDLTLSGTLSMLLASAVFALIFRRIRALVAVMPPLILGTAWTAGLATLFPGGLSAIAVAFMSVVVGVGVDTGVHVYAALLDARRDGLGPTEAAIAARRKTGRAVLLAAITAGAAFAALSLSDINAVRQLGILCGAGEVLTAIAIILVTPEIGALLERGAPPPPLRARWTSAVTWLTATRSRALVAAAIALAPIPALIVLGPPSLAEAIVAIRPQKMAPLAVQREIFEAFGGKRGHWVALVADREHERARERADALVEALSALTADVESVDALTAIAPSRATQLARYAARDALDLPKRADELEKALAEVGFVPERFSAALDSMRHAPHTEARLDDLQHGAAAILLSRYLAEDQGDTLVAIYLRPTMAEGAIARIDQAIRAADPEARLTGYSRLDASLRAALVHDMPRIGVVAGLLVLLALGASLRRAGDVILAALVVSAEVAAVLLLIRVLRIPLHVYDALVLPVLLGITVDEGMFLLHHARESQASDVHRDTLDHEGPSIAATALTTAAGFGALGFCDFDGLRDLGQVGAIGSTVGLVVALVVVPAGLRLRAGR
ncbi:MAG: MMPL family transporter [Byssovorax sp.]